MIAKVIIIIRIFSKRITKNCVSILSHQKVNLFKLLKGYFEPNQILEFDASFLSDDYIPIYEYATLFIDDIPY